MREVCSLVCLPQIKSGHIDDEGRPGSDGKERVPRSRRRVISARPCSTTSECAFRCSSSCTTATRGADGVRQTPLCDQHIPCGSSRSAVLHKHFAKVSEETSDDLECRSIGLDV